MPLDARQLLPGVCGAPPPRCSVHHSLDRPVTYIPTDEGWLYLAGVIALCSRKIVGWSMADHMKSELVHHERYVTREQAKQSISEYIEVFYNRKRLHSSLGYQSPETFEPILN